jgi:hypothetical protein
VGPNRGIRVAGSCGFMAVKLQGASNYDRGSVRWVGMRGISKGVERRRGIWNREGNGRTIWPKPKAFARRL